MDVFGDGLPVVAPRMAGQGSGPDRCWLARPTAPMELWESKHALGISETFAGPECVLLACGARATASHRDMALHHRHHRFDGGTLVVLLSLFRVVSGMHSYFRNAARGSETGILFHGFKTACGRTAQRHDRTCLVHASERWRNSEGALAGFDQAVPCARSRDHDFGSGNERSSLHREFMDTTSFSR